MDRLDTGISYVLHIYNRRPNFRRRVCQYVTMDWLLTYNSWYVLDKHLQGTLAGLPCPGHYDGNGLRLDVPASTSCDCSIFP